MHLVNSSSRVRPQWHGGRPCGSKAGFTTSMVTLFHVNSRRSCTTLVQADNFRLAQQPVQPSCLQAACSVSKAAIGVNPQGFRGLLATSDIPDQEVVITIPLHNMLMVPRDASQPQMQEAMAAATSTWQEHHGPLPQPLLSLLASTDAVWEAKLVAWLLYLRAAAPHVHGPLWHSYCQALPTAAETITFCSYSDLDVEQLQFSTWKTLAQRQRQLLLTVQQQCHTAGLDACCMTAATAATSPASSGAANNTSSSSGSSSGLSQQALCEADYAWALSMVKSRTFGQRLRSVQPRADSTQYRGTQAAGTAAASGLEQPPSAVPAAAAEPAAAGAAGKALELDKGDDADVVLLMAPFLDMINHAPDNNCVFGIDPEGNSFSVRCSCSSGIPRGQEVTISYGSNKSNLALLSCYGFQIPANPNDIQLVTPIFKSCLAAADSLQGFDPQLLQEAADRLGAQRRAQTCAGQQQQQQQGQKERCEQQQEQHLEQQHEHKQQEGQQQAACGLDAGMEQVMEGLMSPELAAARQRNALAAVPVDQQQLQKPCSLDQQQQLLQQQKYLAQLMLYQLALIFKRCASSIEEDMLVLAQLQEAAAAGCSSGSSVDALIRQQAVSARVEHKLLLHECEQLLQQLLELLEAKLMVARP